MKKSIYDTGYIELTKWLKYNREQKKITLRGLAKKLHISHSIVWGIENSSRRLDVLEYMEYCKALDLDPLEGINIIQKYYKID